MSLLFSSLYLISKDLCKYDIIRIFGIVIYLINIILLESFYRNKNNNIARMLYDTYFCQ